MMTIEHIKNAMRLYGNVIPGDLVGVALSGGADSVALTVALSDAGFDVTALHCNFNLRGEESDGDEIYCRELAASLGIVIEVLDVDTMAEKLPGESVEMTCRRLRYEWFEKQAKRLGLKCVAIAHHREDCVETVMLNLLRGTGTAGLAGIRPRRGIFVRPMLDLGRDEIELFLRERGLSWRTDSSNLSTDYRRNALRNDILPLVEKYFPDACRGILTTSHNMAAADRIIGSVAEHIVAAAFRDGALRLDLIGDPDVLVRCVQLCFGVVINHSVAADILLCKEGRSGRFATGGEGVELELSRGALRLCDVMHNGGDEAFLFSPSDGCRVEAGNIVIECRIMSRNDFLVAPRNATRIYLDYDALLGDNIRKLILRHPRTGDRMKPFGMKGSRLLSDLLKEAAVAPSARADRWVVTAGDDILWLVGIRGSSRYAVGTDTSRVLCLTLI